MEHPMAAGTNSELDRAVSLKSSGTDMNDGSFLLVFSCGNLDLFIIYDTMTI